MDLDRLPHFRGAPSPSGPLRSGSSGPLPPPPAAPPAVELTPLAGAGGGPALARQRSSRGGDWRLMFPHGEGKPVPSYVEELNDVRALLARQLGGCAGQGGGGAGAGGREQGAGRARRRLRMTAAR